MKLPLYVFGKQTLETFLLAALEGCESNQKVYIATHPMHQRQIATNTTGATYLLLEVSDEGVIEAVDEETHLLVLNTKEVLDSYESESPVIKDVIAFVLDNDKAMKNWYTKTYGSPTALKAFIDILSEVLYQGRDFEALLDIVGKQTDLQTVASTWTQKIDEHGIVVIDEVSPTKAHAAVIFKSLADIDRVRGLRIYSNGVLKHEMLKEIDEE